MYRQTDSGKRVIKLMDAFSRDGFEIGKIIVKFGKTGIMAESKTASNYDTGLKKKAYYLEGSSYEMGYLLGALAENDIAEMTGDFTEKVVFAFIKSKVLEKIKIIQEAFVHIMYDLAKSEYPKLPEEFKDEIQGILDGCKSSNPKTKVTLERLIVLNLGVDILCSMVYSGSFPLFRLEGIDPVEFKIPIMCNAFSVFGNSAGGGHYFGRDFMFPTADVFHKAAAMIIYNPINNENKTYPFVSVTAPGMIGCIAGMNKNGIGIGVDMSPGANSDPRNPGINSLLLARLSIQNGGSADDVVEIMKNTKRGVSWNYVIADGSKDRACVVEAGSSDSSSDFTNFPSAKYKELLPDLDYIKNHTTAEFLNGLMVRWNDYKYPDSYLDFNEALWNHYNELNSTDRKIYPDAFTNVGYINKMPNEQNCPSAFYFAPQREDNEELLIVTNHYLIPEMRYYTMHSWTSKITGDITNDIQWRYDELNFLINNALQEKGQIDYKTAKSLIDFLSPNGYYPAYYAKNPKSSDGKQIRIEGCVSVFDLKNLLVESHYGYYCDEWVKITLSHYVV